jgi:hypothetical protein
MEDVMGDVGTLLLYKPPSYSVESQGGNCGTQLTRLNNGGRGGRW